MNATAANFERIIAERDRHNATCGFPAHTVLMNPITIDRLGWEAGDTIGGLVLTAAAEIQTDCFQLLCDKDRLAPESVEAISTEKEVVHA